MNNRRNYYRVLHVQPDAPKEIIRMSYLTLMQRLKMHPDLGGDHVHAALLNEAFATLFDPVTRAAYDRSLALASALPGYRSTTRRTPSDHIPVQPPKLAPFTCSFCGRPFSRHDADRVDALCGFCESPLYPASRHEHDTESRRAMTRTAFVLRLTYYLSWPQHAGIAAETEDVSITGMRLSSPLDLVPHERIKIVSDLCDAVAVVRHAHAIDASRWSVGVEFLTLRISTARGLLVSRQA